jgi:hypothetical protein
MGEEETASSGPGSASERSNNKEAGNNNNQSNNNGPDGNGTDCKHSDRSPAKPASDTSHGHRRREARREKDERNGHRMPRAGSWSERQRPGERACMASREKGEGPENDQMQLTRSAPASDTGSTAALAADLGC